MDNKAQGHPPFSGNYPVYIGRWLGDSYFNGYIDEIRIWKTARTDEEIKDNSRKQPAKRDDANLTAYWRLTDQPGDKKTIPDLKETAKKLNGALNKPAKAIWSQAVG
ncbi:MAG: LamG domain-containing protein [Deltaproteobacteria bacterium]|nr:LamG domain-containing protein [Deltaproteobacteria bacterium]